LNRGVEEVAGDEANNVPQYGKQEDEKEEEAY
jgi:hypothetical protein